MICCCWLSLPCLLLSLFLLRFIGITTTLVAAAAVGLIYFVAVVVVVVVVVVVANRVSGVTDHFAHSDEHAIQIARSIVSNLNWHDAV